MKLTTQIVFLLVLILILTNCKDDALNRTKVKYHFGNTIYDCTGYYKKGNLVKVLCFNNDSVKVIEHKYALESDSNSLSAYYDNGELKEEGFFLRNSQVGVWKIYYQNGSLKEYRFYKLNNAADSTTLIYNKQYDIEGNLISCYLPLQIRKDSLPKILRKDSTYKLYVDLEYSEFDSVNSTCILDPFPFSSLGADTSAFYGRSLYYEFTPIKTGKDSISGTYFEMNANHKYKDEKTIAEYPFKLVYEVE